MKIIKKSRFDNMRAQISVQALAIKFLQQENQKQAERIAGLEALLYSAGVLGREDFEASAEEKAWIASVMLAGVEERTKDEILRCVQDDKGVAE